MIRRSVAMLPSVVIWAAIAAGVMVMLLQLGGDRAGQFITPLQTLTPWVMPVVVAVAVVASCRDQHGAAVGAACVGASYLALVAPLVFPPALDRPAEGATLTVLHANLLYSNPDIGAAIAVVREADADVIAVSELTPAFAEAMAASGIGADYPHTLLRPGNAALGLGIWSRRPLADAEPIGGTAMSLVTSVEPQDGKSFRLVLTHPLPPLFDEPKWRTEIDALAAQDPLQLERTVMVGDFNVSYFNPPYRRFIERTAMSDVHQVLGRGFSASWPTDERVPAFVRLDHALIGRRLAATAIVDVDIPGSDHRAFVVTVAAAE